jgi:hypothetical protein
VSLPPELAASIAKNDRILKRWLLSGLAVVLCIATVFAFWWIEGERDAWFKRIAHIDAGGVDVIAEVRSTQCKSLGATKVHYRWRHGGTEYAGTGASCTRPCQDLDAGDAVGLRFMPSRPSMFACLPSDMRRETEAPHFSDGMIPLVLVIAVIFFKLREAYREAPN